MAIAFIQQASGASSSNVTTYNLFSWSPGSTNMLLAFVGSSASVTGTPTLTGNSLTWNLFRGALDVTSTFATASYWANGTGATTGILTYETDAADPATGVALQALGFSGVHPTTPIRQSAYENGLTGTVPTISFPSPTVDGNAVVVFLHCTTVPTTFTVPVESGWFLVGSAPSYASPTFGTETMMNTDPGVITTITLGDTAPSAWKMVAVELASAEQATVLDLISNAGTTVTPAVIQASGDGDTYRNHYDGTNGVTITTSNSDINSDDWAEVVIGAGSTAVYDTATFLHGVSSGAFNPATGVSDYAGMDVVATAELYGRVYFRSATLPAALLTIMSLRDNTTATIRGRLTLQTDGRIRLINGASTNVGTTPNNSTGIIPAATWARIEWHWIGNATTGLLECKLFIGANVEGLVPDSVTTASAINTVGSIDRVRIGQSTSQATDILVHNFDELFLDTAGYPGPYVPEERDVTLGLINRAGNITLGVGIDSVHYASIPLDVINQTGTTVAPTISSTGQAQFVALPVLGAGWGTMPWGDPWGGTRSRTFDPVVMFAYQLSLINQAGVTINPIVNSVYVSLPLISNAGQILGLSPEVRWGDISLGLISNAGEILDLSVTAETWEVTLSAIDQTGVTLTPFVTEIVTLPLMTQYSGVINPEVRWGDITLGLINQAGAIVALQAVSADAAGLSLISQAGTTLALAISPHVELTAIDQTGITIGPQILQFAESTVELELLNNTGQILDIVEVYVNPNEEITLSLINNAGQTKALRVYSPYLPGPFLRGRWNPDVALRGKWNPEVRLKGRLDGIA